MVLIKHVLENVASMDKLVANEVNKAMGNLLLLLDPIFSVPIRRLRYCWTSEKLDGVFPDVQLELGRYWIIVHSYAEYPKTE